LHYHAVTSLTNKVTFHLTLFLYCTTPFSALNAAKDIVISPFIFLYTLQFPELYPQHKLEATYRPTSRRQGNEAGKTFLLRDGM
jgi:hypothetical protein